MNKQMRNNLILIWMASETERPTFANVYYEFQLKQIRKQIESR